MSVYTDENEFIGETIAKFLPDQLVYIVKQKRKKITITKTRIDCISYLSMTGIDSSLEYFTRYHTYYSKEVYWDDSKNIFTTKEDAYEYAEQLDKRKNIKFKERS